MSKSRFIFNSVGRLIDFTDPKVMGIINLTPDSFYSGSRVTEIDQVVDRVGEMIAQGAEIIDMGAMSSRPGSSELPLEVEINRLTRPLRAVRIAFPDILISVDTYRLEVLQACAEIGINLVNDITGAVDNEEFIRYVGEMKVPYILMHMKGKPKSMQENPQYEDVVLDIMKYMDKQITQCRQAGITDIILDPGFGFGKSLADNYRLLAHLSSFEIFDLPILVGLSRKSMIYKLLNTGSDKALNGTTALHMLALQQGACILRAHDVKEAVECIELWRYFASQN